MVAAGAVPVFRNWPGYPLHGGARALFPADWVVEDVDQAVHRVPNHSDPQVWADAATRHQQQVRELFDPHTTPSRLRQIIEG